MEIQFLILKFLLPIILTIGFTLIFTKKLIYPKNSSIKFNKIEFPKIVNLFPLLLTSLLLMLVSQNINTQIERIFVTTIVLLILVFYHRLSRNE